MVSVEAAIDYLTDYEAFKCAMGQHDGHDCAPEEESEESEEKA